MRCHGSGKQANQGQHNGRDLAFKRDYKRTVKAMETKSFRLAGNYRDLVKGQQYTTTELSVSSGINLKTLRERLARRGKRDMVFPKDLDPVGEYRSTAYRLETDADIFSMSWLRRPITKCSKDGVGE